MVETMGVEELRVQRAEQRDAERIVAMVNGAYRGESGRRGWTTEADLIGGQRIDIDWAKQLILKPDSVILIALNSHNFISGCVYLNLQPQENSESMRVAYLGMLTVDVGFQTHGAGSLLVREAEKFVRTVWQACKMEMRVITVRSELIQWYLRRGYVDSGRREPFPYGDERFGLPFKEGLEFAILEKRL